MTIASNMRAIVTGAGSGLGRALCLELAQHKARILASDIDMNGLQETARLVRELNAEIHIVRTDVTKLEEVEELASKADELLGGCDFVANNAGVAAAGPVGKVPMKDWQWVIDVNLWGVIYGCHVFAPRFKEAGHGMILNVASAAGLVSAPDMGPYNVSKAGVVALSETLNAELIGTGVNVTVLCPTFFQTNIMRAARTNGEPVDMAEKLMARSRTQAGDVAKAAVEACARGELYAVPMLDARMMWRVKRMMPGAFGKVSAWMMNRMKKKSAVAESAA